MTVMQTTVTILHKPYRRQNHIHLTSVQGMGTARETPIVLIAETIPERLQLLANAFRQARFEVRTASSCQECLDIFSTIRGKVDLVLLNGTIPGENGIDLLINIRRIKQDQRILVVVTEFNTRAYAMKLGAEVFLSEPLDIQAILQRAANLLRQDDSFKIRHHQRVAQLQSV